jgi:hypothetical protein
MPDSSQVQLQTAWQSYRMKRIAQAEADILNSPLTAYRLGKAKRVVIEEGTKEKESDL